MKVIRSLVIVSALWCARAAADERPVLPEPVFPAEIRDGLVSVVNDGGSFGIDDIDAEAPQPTGSAALIWSGSAARTEASIPAVTLRLEPEAAAPGSAAAGSDIEILFAPNSFTVRGEKPLNPRYRGGARFAWEGQSVRRIAYRLEGNRELAVFAPPSERGKTRGGIVFCLTAIERHNDSGNGGEKGAGVDVPLAASFRLAALRVQPQASADGRVLSGILPAKARAIFESTANIGASHQQKDETISRDPSVSIIYVPESPAAFMPTSPASAGAMIRAGVELETPAGHQRRGEMETELWVERLTARITRSAGGTDRVPSSALGATAGPQSDDPVYGACFAVAQRARRTSGYAEPPPAPPAETPAAAVEKSPLEGFKVP